MSQEPRSEERSEGRIEVRKLSHSVPVVLLGRDEQGRQLYRCPSAGCGETAYFDEDGRGHCPTHDAITDFLGAALDRLLATQDTTP